MFMVFKTMGPDEITQESTDNENAAWGQSNIQTLNVKDWAEEEETSERQEKNKESVVSWKQKKILQ